MRGAIVLAGGPSRRLGRPKPLVEVGGVPMIARVVNAAREAADDIVVVSRGELAARVQRLLPDVRVVRDRSRVQSPLVGLLAGAEASRSEFVAALPCDLPFVHPSVLRRLFTAAKGAEAAIPRWPDGKIEPLLAVYARVPLRNAARSALRHGERSNQSMIARLGPVRYVDIARLRESDPRLRSFMNVNTPADLARALRMATRSALRPHTR